MAEGQGRFFPEQGNRQPLRGMERRGGTRLNVTGAPPVPGFRPGGVIAPERPAPTPTLPRPDRVQPPPEQAPQKPKTGTRARIALAGLAVVGAGAGAYGAYQNVPAVHRAVDSAFLDHIKGKSLSSEASTEVFNPTATEGVIKPSMIEKVPQGEIDKLDSLAKIDDHNTVRALFPIDLSTSTNPNAEIKYKKANDGNGNEEDSRKRAEQGFLNQFRFDNIPPGTTILSPIDGRLTVYTSSGNRTPVNDHDVITAAIDFMVKDKEFRLIISGGTGRQIGGKLDVFRSLTNAPIVGPSMSPNEVLEIKNQAIAVKRGMPILKVADEKISLSFYMRGDIDMEKMDKSQLKEETIDGRTITTIATLGRENLELFTLNSGFLAAPQH